MSHLIWSFNSENIWVKRPGTGPIFADEYDAIIGKTANNDIDIDTHIEYEDILEPF